MAMFCERIIQAISAIVRSYDLAEGIFCQLEQANDIFRMGFVGGADTNTDDPNSAKQSTLPPLNVRKRTLFFLRSLITSDTTSIQRIQLFQTHVVYVIDHIVLLPTEEYENASTTTSNTVDDEMVEMALGMIQQLLEQRVSVNAVLSRKQPLAAMAVQQISTLRKQQQQQQQQQQQRSKDDDDDMESNEVLLETWERILSLLANAKPDSSIPPVNE